MKRSVSPTAGSAMPRQTRRTPEKPGFVRVTISEEAAVKILRLSDQTRIPTEIVVAEAIRQGNRLLNFFSKITKKLS